MRVLFFDDDHKRHEQFLAMTEGHLVDVVDLFDDYCERLQFGPRYDAVFLDHDLNDLVTQDRVPGMYGDRAYNGVDAADSLRFAILAAWQSPRHVVVHSWNIDGAKRMVATLHNVVPVRQMVFGSQEFVAFTKGLSS